MSELDQASRRGTFAKPPSGSDTRRLQQLLKDLQQLPADKVIDHSSLAAEALMPELGVLEGLPICEWLHSDALPGMIRKLAGKCGCVDCSLPCGAEYIAFSSKWEEFCCKYPEIAELTDPVYVFADPVLMPGQAASGTVTVSVPVVTGWPPAGSPYATPQYSAGAGAGPNRAQNSLFCWSFPGDDAGCNAAENFIGAAQVLNPGMRFRKVQMSGPAPYL